jgi:uncharacterized protein (TIGR02001 family)
MLDRRFKLNHFEGFQMSKKLITAIAAATLIVGALSTPVSAEVTATAGFVSDYYFRGSNLGDGGANGSIDWSEGGLSAGVWAIDDGMGGNDGLEYDLYLAYGVELDAVDLSIGYTRFEYTHTSDFEHEVNLGVAAGAFALAVDIGEDDDDGAADAADYRHVALSWAIDDVYGLTVGNADPDTDVDDNEYNYIEASAAGEVSGLDMSMALGTKSSSDADKAALTTYQDTSGYLVLSASKTFDL